MSKAVHVIISLAATYLVFYVIIHAIRTASNIWVTALILTLLLNIAVFFCPVLHPKIYKKRAVKKAKKK